VTFQLDTSSVKGPGEAGLPPSLDGGAGGPLSDMVAKLMQPSEEEKGAKKEREKASSDLESALKNAPKEEAKTRAELEASMPKPEDYGLGKGDLEKLKPEKSPSYKPDNPLQDFGGIATLLGVFGGMLTRRPLVASLNAASGAMSAYHQRNVEDYEKQVEEWKNNQEYIGKVLDWREKMYASADKRFQNDLAARTAARTEVAARTQDFQTLEQLHAGDEQRYYQTRIDAAKLLQQMGDTNVRLKLQADTLGEKIREDKARDARVSAGTAAQQAKQQAAVKQTDSLIQQTDDLIAMIDANPSVVGGRGIIGGAVQTAKGLINPNAKVDTSYQDFDTKLHAFQTEANLALSGSKYYSSARISEMNKILPGLGHFTSAQDAKAALTQFKDILQGAKTEIPMQATDALGGYTQEDLEYTAAQRGMTVDQVKQRLGVQ
jgi:hypothetical protein